MHALYGVADTSIAVVIVSVLHCSASNIRPSCVLRYYSMSLATVSLAFVKNETRCIFGIKKFLRLCKLRLELAGYVVTLMHSFIV